MSKAAGWAAALGLFLGGGAALGGASGGETYPVWLAPELGLENLDEIDAALARPFPEGKRAVFHKFGRHMIGEGDTAYPGEWGSLDAQPIDNCLAYLKWTDEGYQPENEDEDSYWVYETRAGYCLALRALKRARPATTSYLRDFGFTHESLDYLPALLNAVGCKHLPPELLANRNGVPWSKFVHPAFGPRKHFANLVVRDLEHFVYEAWSSSEMTEKYHEDAFSIIGRGDLDGNGLDDLLVRRDFLGFSYGKLRGPPETVLFLLSRDREGAVLRVIDAHGYRGGGGRSCLNAEILSYY